MSVSIEIYTERKGSNPGGKCLVTTPSTEFDAYVKYCPTSRIRSSSFSAAHQPIYEATTLSLARILGLITPEFYVLCNPPTNKIKFSYDPTIHKKQQHIQEEMPFYLISKLMEVPPSREEDPRQKGALAREKLYRDLLLVSDISNKAQNFRYDPLADRMVYLDLGCSFVNAVEGYLLKSTFKTPMHVSKKELRDAEKVRENSWIIKADDTNILPLDEVLNVRNLSIPLLNSSTREHLPLSKLLSETELDELTRMLNLNLIRVIRKHKRSPLLISN